MFSLPAQPVFCDIFNILNPLRTEFIVNNNMLYLYFFILIFTFRISVLKLLQ